MSKREKILKKMKKSDLQDLIKTYQVEHENSGLIISGNKDAIVNRILAFEKKIKKSKKSKKIESKIEERIAAAKSKAKKPAAKKKGKCGQYKKTRAPKCEDQASHPDVRCKWVPGKGKKKGECVGVEDDSASDTDTEIAELTEQILHRKR